MEYDTSEGYADADFSRHTVNGRARKTGGDDYLPESMHRQLHKTELPDGRLACEQTAKRGHARRKRSMREMIDAEEAIEQYVDRASKRRSNADARKKKADRALEHIRTGLLLASGGNVQVHGLATPGQVAFRVYKHEFDEYKLPREFFREYKLQRGRGEVPEEVQNTHVQLADVLHCFEQRDASVVHKLIEGFCDPKSSTHYLDYGDDRVQTGVVTLRRRPEVLRGVCRFHPFWVRDAMRFALYVVILYDRIEPLEAHKAWQGDAEPNEGGVYVDFFYRCFASDGASERGAPVPKKSK